MTPEDHRYFVVWPDSSSTIRELRGPVYDPALGIPDIRYPLAVLAQAQRTLSATIPLHFYLTKDPERLPEYGPHVVAVLLQEERCKIPRYLRRVGAIIRNLPTTPFIGFRAHRGLGRLEGALLFEYMRDWLLHARSRVQVESVPHATSTPGTHIVTIPLGYQSQEDLPQRPMAERTLDTFFAGDIATPFLRSDYRYWIPPSKTFARRQLWEVLAALEASGRWHIDLHNVRPDEAMDHAARYRTYSERMMNSRICVAPRGSQAETYRFYEGLRAGCLVISNPNPPEPFLKDAPALIVDHWTELPALLERYARDLDALERFRSASLAWWRDHCSEPVIAAHVAQSLNRLPLAAPASQHREAHRESLPQ